jgi:hypothetical protein
MPKSKAIVLLEFAEHRQLLLNLEQLRDELATLRLSNGQSRVSAVIQAIDALLAVLAFDIAVPLGYVDIEAVNRQLQEAAEKDEAEE